MAANAETPPAEIVPGIPYSNSTGLGGSPGTGTNPVNLAPIGAPVIVTTVGASSVPPQPMTTVDIGDSSVPSQVQQFVPGHVDSLTGAGPYGQTGITTGGHASHEVAAS